MASQSTNHVAKPPPPGPKKTPLEWAAERLASLRAPRAMAPLRIPRRPKLRAQRPTWFPSFWAARLAVRAGLPLDEFLRHRLTRHLSTLAVSPSQLPVQIGVEDGGAIAVRPVESSERSPWLQSFLRAEGPKALAPEIQLAQADVARLAARIDVQRKRVDEAARQVDEVTRGVELADPADEAQAKQMGRPHVPAPVGQLLQAFAAALLLAETWQLAIPCLEAAGIRTLDLGAELHRNPVGLVLGTVFALGAAASLFLLAFVALRRGADAFAAVPEGRRRAWGAVAAAAAAAMGVAMAWSIAGMRPGAQRVDAGYAHTTLFLVALAIPITTAWLLRTAAALEAARSQAIAAARAWDQEHYRTLAEIGRHAAALEEEERRCARLEADRAATVRRLRALQARAVAAERLAADAAEDERSELGRLAHVVVAGLELDRYEYLRQAAAAGLRVDRRPAASTTPVPVRHAEEHLGLAG